MNLIPCIKIAARKPSAAISAFIILSLINCLTAGARAQTRGRVAIFAISSESAGEGSMDAVAVLDGKNLRAPYADDEKDHQRFGSEYWSPGKTFRLIFGGGDAGTVTVGQWSRGCETIHAQVTLKTSARVGGKVMALATSSDSLGKRSVSRRPPTDAERAATLALMKSIYQENRTPATLMNSIKVTNLTATDLNGDGKYEMIGSFTLTAKNKFERDLFLIAIPQGATMRAEFVKFQAYQPPPEGFLSSIDFVDQLDIDGDGTAEVFAVQGGFDGYAYLILKKVSGRWRKIFDMAGDAC